MDQVQISTIRISTLERIATRYPHGQRQLLALLCSLHIPETLEQLPVVHSTSRSSIHVVAIPST